MLAGRCLALPSAAAFPYPLRDMFKLLGSTIAAGVVLVLLTAFAYRAYAQNRGAEALAIHSVDGIEEAAYLKLGGVEQWVQIRGESRTNPVLLVLHGGPGMSYMPFTALLQPWEKYFTVVQWDRRGVGKTYRRLGGGGPDSVTFDRLADDGVELVQYLREHLHQDKIGLLGHSVGSIVGVLMAQKRPDLLYAYVGADQIVDGSRNEKLSYDLLVERTKSSLDTQAIRAVAKLPPPPYQNADVWFEKQKWISATDASGPSFENKLFKLVATAPNMSLPDMAAFGAGLKFSAAALLHEMMTIDLRAHGLTFKTPVIVIEGEHDVLDPTALAVEYFNTIEAPAKRLAILKGLGHGAMLANPDTFFEEMRSQLQPLLGKQMRPP
jgi:pimeloyl-ACP methyl ester carboxylesterase